MATLKVTIRDAVSGAPIEAKVHVLSAGGRFLQPAGSVCKVGPGMPFFYCPGEFTLSAQRGSTDIVAERGTECPPLRRVVSMPAKGSVEVEMLLERWIDSLRGNGTRATPTSITTSWRRTRTCAFNSTRLSTI
jgi:hypothetical protein